MFETDREIYLAFAKAMGLDFAFTRKLIDGQMAAGAELARALAGRSGTRERLWTSEGKAQERLVAVKVWYVVESRRPKIQSQETPPLQTRRGGCRNCD